MDLRPYYTLIHWYQIIYGNRLFYGHSGYTPTMLVELGGGTNPHPRADIVIDLHHPKGCAAQNAEITPWLGADGNPIPDNSVDEIWSSHFMEHVHKGQPLIDVMNEAHRILKPNGTYTMTLPLVGFTNPTTGLPDEDKIGWQPWSDPTHVSYWWFPESISYFCEGQFNSQVGANYGMNLWAPLGGVATPAQAIQMLQQGGAVSAFNQQSFWSILRGWEGVARIVKPGPK